MRTSLLLLFLVPLSVFCQDPYLARLPIEGGISEIAVSPSENIWIATKTGNTYYTHSIGDLWHLGPFGSFDPYDHSIGQTFERVNFFDENTLMISGYIQSDTGTDFVYRSTDKGVTWDTVKFGKSSWIDAAYINENGKAWMSGSSQLIYYTDNKGATWKSFDKAGDENALRFATIHFDTDETTGLFGSFWNVLYKTTDNCISWERLPTPLDQKKYKRLSKKHRPDIRKIRIMGDYYIINQQGHIFYTKKDSINWMALPNMSDFETTKDAVYFISNDLKIELRDANFRPTWESTARLKRLPRALKTKNNSLFAFTYDEIYKINTHDFSVSKLMTNEVPIRKPQIIVNHKGENIGFEDHSLLRFDNERSAWYRFMEVPISVSNAAIMDDQLIIADQQLRQRFVVDIDQQQTTPYQLPKSLFDLTHNPIEFLSIESGSQGCYHQNKQIRAYHLKDNKLQEDTKTPDFLPKMEAEMDPEIVNALINTIDSARYKRLRVKDLEVSKQDREQFKTFIDAQAQKMKKQGYDHFNFRNPYRFRGENTDFDFYKKVADHFEDIPDAVINQVFHKAYGSWSTTKVWTKITIGFKNGDVLTIENTDDIPNYLYAPWTLNVNGLTFKSNSIKLGRLINALTKGDLFTDVSKEKTYAIFKVADFLYKQSLTTNE